MQATHTFATLCARLNRSPLYVRGLQRRFGLPIPADSPSPPRSPRLGGGNSPDPTVPPSNCPTVRPPSSYSPSYLAFLETIIHLRILGVPEETLTRLWNLERKLMDQLHATGSPTWFLDACGAIGNRDHRLLLSNFDIGAFLPSGSVQLGLDFSGKAAPELFTAPEMGEDAILVLRQYITLHQEIFRGIHQEHPIVRAALKHFSPMTNDALSRKPSPKPKNQIGSLIPGEI
ncbi:MAG: hypothetical protein ACOYOU_20605 [Kiritimatiellia bacterium]